MWACRNEEESRDAKRVEVQKKKRGHAYATRRWSVNRCIGGPLRTGRSRAGAGGGPGGAGDVMDRCVCGVLCKMMRIILYLADRKEIADCVEFGARCAA